MERYVGLDVHSKTTFVHVQDAQGNKVFAGEIATAAQSIQDLLAELEVPQGTRVALETGTQAQFVAGVLKACAMEPVVVSANEVRAKARRTGQKCDSRDAMEICDGLRRGIWQSIVWVPTGTVADLRVTLSRRFHFVKVRTMERNAVRFLLRAEGLKLLVRAQLSSEAGWKKLLEDERIAAVRGYVEMHLELWRAAKQQIEKLDKEIDQLLGEQAEVSDILQSTPGIGPVSAATFIAAVGDPSRFADSHRVASYLGLVPSSYSSGESERLGHITRTGNPVARAMLVEAAQQARRASHPLHPYLCSLAAKKGEKIAIIAVAHRLVRIMYQLWKKKERFDLSKLNVVFDPHERKKKVYFSLKSRTLAARS